MSWCIFYHREMRAPIIIAIALVLYVIGTGRWVALIGLPLVYLGWCACAPNLNLADGCLPIFCTVLLLIIGAVLASFSLLIAAAACGGTWIVTSVESAWRARPWEPDA